MLAIDMSFEVLIILCLASINFKSSLTLLQESSTGITTISSNNRLVTRTPQESPHITATQMPPESTIQSKPTTTATSKTTSAKQTCIPWPDIRCSNYSYEDCLEDAKTECNKRYVIGIGNSERNRLRLQNRRKKLSATLTRSQSLDQLRSMGAVNIENLFA